MICSGVNAQSSAGCWVPRGSGISTALEDNSLEQDKAIHINLYITMYTIQGCDWLLTDGQ